MGGMTRSAQSKLTPSGDIKEILYFGSSTCGIGPTGGGGGQAAPQLGSGWLGADKCIAVFFSVSCPSRFTTSPTHGSSSSVSFSALTTMHRHPCLQTHISQPLGARVLLAFHSVPCSSGFTLRRALGIAANTNRLTQERLSVTSGEKYVVLPILTMQRPAPSWKVKVKLKECSIV